MPKMKHHTFASFLFFPLSLLESVAWIIIVQQHNVIISKGRVVFEDAVNMAG